MSTSSSSSASVTAPLYGYDVISQRSAKIISSLFPPATPRPGAKVERAAKPLEEFIAYALFRTRLHDTIVYAALFLLARLKKLYPAAKGTPTSPHRLFISSLMLSSKMLMDDTYSNKSWTIVTQDMFQLDEVNRMERELFGFLNKNVYVGFKELKDWCREWCVDDVKDVEEPENGLRSSSPTQVVTSPVSQSSPMPASPSTPVALIPASPPVSSPPAISSQPPIEASHIHTSDEVNGSMLGASRYNSSSPESSVGVTTPSSPTRPAWMKSKSKA